MRVAVACLFCVAWTAWLSTAFVMQNSCLSAVLNTVQSLPRNQRFAARFMAHSEKDRASKSETNKVDASLDTSTSRDRPISRTDAVRQLLNSQPENDTEDTMDTDAAATQRRRRELVINAVAGGLLVASAVAGAQLYRATLYTPTGFQRLPSTQFIAALGDPNANSGVWSTEQPWGLWPLDPGPRGIWLRDYKSSTDSDQNTSTVTGRAPITTPSGWTLDPTDWWLEEHGILMEAPQFPIPNGRYLVTGGRDVVTGLTIQNGRWRLDDDHVLFDVTHLPCRAARYRTAASSPAAANPRDFPVAPGATMPSVSGCTKQDYAVLFLVGKAD
jgi:hypothetical protein